MERLSLLVPVARSYVTVFFQESGPLKILRLIVGFALLTIALTLVLVAGLKAARKHS